MSNTEHKSESSLLIIEKVLLLKSLSLFAETPETVLVEVAEILEEVEAGKGTHIFNRGDIANCMYIIFKGEVLIHHDGKPLATLKENDFFGELSLLDTETRSAGAKALMDVVLLKLDQDPFYEIMESRIEVAKGIIKTLCRRLRNQNMKSLEKQAVEE
jgi:CRP/FNR family cyclic AMP-dependent transcriptional regulator